MCEYGPLHLRAKMLCDDGAGGAEHSVRVVCVVECEQAREHVSRGRVGGFVFFIVDGEECGVWFADEIGDVDVAATHGALDVSVFEFLEAAAAVHVSTGGHCGDGVGDGVGVGVGVGECLEAHWTLVFCLVVE